jgi:hypothetical protein
MFKYLGDYFLSSIRQTAKSGRSVSTSLQPICGLRRKSINKHALKVIARIHLSDRPQKSGHSVVVNQ